MGMALFYIGPLHRHVFGFLVALTSLEFRQGLSRQKTRVSGRVIMHGRPTFFRLLYLIYAKLMAYVSLRLPTYFCRNFADFYR